MSDDDTPTDPKQARGFSRRNFVRGGAASALGLYGLRSGARPAKAEAAAGVPNPITVENANAGTAEFKLGAGTYSGAMGGYTDLASIDKGDPLSVKINTYDEGGTGTTARLDIFRLGYYGGAGGRLVGRKEGVALTNQGFAPAFTDLGYTSVDSTWARSEEIDTSGFETGVYLVKIVSATGKQTHMPFVVRDDSRPRDLLCLIPTNTYQAYNSWPGKCLYNAPSYDSGKTTQMGLDGNGQSRAAKVSFDRQHNNVYDDLNWVLRTEFPLIYWLERMGYDVSYTEDVAFHRMSAAELQPGYTKVLAIAGHAEYWTQEMMAKAKAARDAGVSIASFSANAAYWKVRYEDNQRTLVCFKTVQGRTANGADLGKDGVNDYGPLRADGATGGATARGGPFDPLTKGASYATTTFRDNGAPVGDPNGPDGASPRQFEGNRRVGPDTPENSLWGVMYIGDHDVVSYPLQVPAGSGSGGEFGAHRAWRNTDVARGGGAQIGRNLVGWEWDAIPNQSFTQYSSKAPASKNGIKRLAETDVKGLLSQVPADSRGGFGYLQDEGRGYKQGPSATPPASTDGKPHTVIYTAPSGAQVFSAGTMQWSFGLGPHFDSIGDRTYEDSPVDDSTATIQQATFNILTDMGITPSSAVGVIADTSAAPPVPPPATGAPVVSKPDTTPPKLVTKTGTRRIDKKGRVSVRFTAAKDTKRPFAGKLVLHLEIPRAPVKGKKRKPRKVKISQKTLSFTPGQTRVASFAIPKRYRELLARKGKLRAVVETRATDSKGYTIKRSASFLLRSRPK